MKQDIRKSNKKLLVKLFGFVVLMFGFGYALVPLYNTFCQVLGINGKTNDAPVSLSTASHIDKTRTVKVQFLATNSDNLAWEFTPTARSIEIHPGEIKAVSYFAKNTTKNKMMVQAIPSVTPGIAAKYLKKTECFCFTQQILNPGDSMDMPLLFHLDPELPQDINTITLSYTLFDVTDMKLKPSASAGRIS